MRRVLECAYFEIICSQAFQVILFPQHYADIVQSGSEVSHQVENSLKPNMKAPTAHRFALVLGAVGYLSTGVGAWGAFGHETVAYVATNFVSASTKTYFQTLLGDTSADYLATVSTWADSYRSTTAGKFSAPFHYIDAQDNPPSSCGVNYDRDCGSEGCVVSAISNYVSAC